MADIAAEYRLILKSKLESRKIKNKRYSLRAFARDLDIDASYLAKINSGKVLLSVDLAAQIANKLNLSQDKYTQFILSAADEQKCHALYFVDPSLTDCDQ